MRVFTCGFVVRGFDIDEGLPMSSYPPSAFSHQQGETMRDFKSLKVWEKAHGLTLDVYRARSGSV